MKDAKIVLVAAWSGWCGACAAERPLVLTRTGGRSLRAWLTAGSAPGEVLTLTCRLCGVGTTVPPEHEDPEVDLTAGPEPAPPTDLTAVPPHVEPAAAGAPAGTSVDALTAVLDAPVLPVVPSPREVPVLLEAPVLREAPVDADVQAARQAIAAQLHALLARRAAAAHQTVPVAPEAGVPPFAPLPTQRSSTESVSGLEALQLLAEGIDLLTPSRP